MSVACFRRFAVLLLIFELVRGQKSDFSSQHRNTCCLLGSSFGRSNYGLDCTGTQHPLQNTSFSEADKESCAREFSRCCTDAADRESCKEGKAAAFNHICDSHHRINESRFAFELCCNVCLFSLQSSRVYTKCENMPDKFGIFFTDCCDKSSSYTPPESVRVPRAECVASEGCLCRPGFQMVNGRCEDVNECQREETQCKPGFRCDNTAGSFLCVRETSCGTGYTWNSDEEKCEDMDECLASPNPCGPLTVCNNTEGSFRCMMSRKCPRGMMQISGRCSYINCRNGTTFNFETSRCEDGNECSSNPCSQTERCVSLAGSYECHPEENVCTAGYSPHPVTGQCQDIDECLLGTHDCRHDQTCFNTVSSYECKCPTGYRLDNERQCVDEDECLIHGSPALCPSSSSCINTIGSFRCDCKPGYRYNISNPAFCEDIDECSDPGHECEQSCFNTIGSYECRCGQGFVLIDDKNCRDIDECKIEQDNLAKKKYANKRMCQGICNNTVGSYKCSCPPGYTVSGRSCDDVNECLSHPCHDADVCLNTRGGYKCRSIRCPEGYVRDPQIPK